jgi:hypothetical protein
MAKHVEVYAWIDTRVEHGAEPAKRWDWRLVDDNGQVVVGSEHQGFNERNDAHASWERHVTTIVQHIAALGAVGPDAELVIDVRYVDEVA